MTRAPRTRQCRCDRATECGRRRRDAAARTAAIVRSRRAAASISPSGVPARAVIRVPADRSGGCPLCSRVDSRSPVDGATVPRLRVAADDPERPLAPRAASRIAAVRSCVASRSRHGSSEPRQVRMRQPAAVHAQRTVLGAPRQRRNRLIRIEQAQRLEGMLDGKNASSSAGENCTHMESIFSTPTPCSPVIVPPSSTHSSRMSAPNRSARSHSPGMLASNRISGCKLPSPA